MSRLKTIKLFVSYMVAFTKMHGLGNDFVIIDKNELPAELIIYSNDLENWRVKQGESERSVANLREHANSPKFCDDNSLKQKSIQNFSLNIANRCTGIGCDQVIFYQKKAGYYEMLIYNNDGSSAKLCGNASRCLAKLIYLSTGERQIKLKVDNRELLCEVISDNEISVNVGVVQFNKEWMPAIETLWPVAELYMIDLKEIICADVGNPHLVIFSDISDQDKDLVGERLQNLFTDGVNVNFASVKNNKIYLSVWERGAGLTLACGSGACASFASAIKLGFITDNCEVVFQLGSLKMSKNGEDIIMTGPASLVARGEFIYG